MRSCNLERRREGKGGRGREGGRGEEGRGEEGRGGEGREGGERKGGEREGEREREITNLGLKALSKVANHYNLNQPRQTITAGKKWYKNPNPTQKRRPAIPDFPVLEHLHTLHGSSNRSQSNSQFLPTYPTSKHSPGMAAGFW